MPLTCRLIKTITLIRRYKLIFKIIVKNFDAILRLSKYQKEPLTFIIKFTEHLIENGITVVVDLIIAETIETISTVGLIGTGTCFEQPVIAICITSSAIVGWVTWTTTLTDFFFEWSIFCLILINHINVHMNFFLDSYDGQLLKLTYSDVFQLDKKDLIYH